MEIIVLEQLLKQTKKRQMTPEVVSRVYQEIELLERLRCLGNNSLLDYLKNQNGKKMKGAEYIYKYRISDGDRILYTYGRYLKYIRKEDQDSLVIIAYAKHDDQGNIGLPERQEYRFGKEIIETFCDIGITAQDLADMSMEDLDAFEEILSEHFINFHSLYVFSGHDISNLEPDTYDVYLSDEQSDYIDQYMAKPRPVLIIGGAGTGKTVMATHILADYRIGNDHSCCAYFTQSKELLHRIEKQYKYLSQKNRVRVNKQGADEETRFFNINDYCRNKLGLLEKDFIETDQFLEFAANTKEISSKLKQYNIEAIDLWAEIRGTIKGGLDPNWHRFVPKNRQDYKREVINELDKAGLLSWQQNKKYFVLSNCKFNEADFSNDAVSVYKELKDYFNSVDPNSTIMERDYYLQLSPELTTLNPEYRKVAYELCQLYQQWLGENRYDENDLILKMMKRPDLSEKFDMVVVDEIQDYTELQIYYLYTLTKDVRHFIMAGDAHQNINPTIFSERRVRALVGNTLMRCFLSRNFRCQKKIIDLANGLSELRNHYIAKDKGDGFEVSERDGATPVLLSYNEKNEEELITALIEYPSTAILVPTEKDKDRLMSIQRSISKDAPDIVFTVAEIKGMEYQYVVCYNLINYYKKVWTQIIEQGRARKETKYRYYFNLFYVGITRAQDYLVFFEPGDSNVFYSKLEETSKSQILKVDEFDIDSVLIANLTNSEEEWLEQARKYEEAGKYTQALQRYRKANAPESIIKTCEMKSYAEKRDYEHALAVAVELGDKESVLRMLPEIEENGSLYRLLSIWSHPEDFSKNNGATNKTLTDLITDAFDIKTQTSMERLFIHWIDKEFENITGNIIKE